MVSLLDWETDAAHSAEDTLTGGLLPTCTWVHCHEETLEGYATGQEWRAYSKFLEDGDLALGYFWGQLVDVVISGHLLYGCASY